MHNEHGGRNEKHTPEKKIVANSSTFGSCSFFFNFRFNFAADIPITKSQKKTTIHNKTKN
jgi:hypothetical protein